MIDYILCKYKRLLTKIKEIIIMKELKDTTLKKKVFSR